MGNRARRYFLPILCVLLIICNYSKGQQTTDLVDSYDLLTQGVTLIDSSQFDKASELFEQITRNDTNYVLALYEDAISRISAGEDSLGSVICHKGIALKTQYSCDFYKFLANAYIDMDKNKEAIKLLRDTAIPAYPNVYLMQYSLGLAYYKSHMYDSAIAALERSINMNVFHASSHYYLGKCCLEQGRMIPALLSFQFFLMLEPGTSRSFSTIQLMEQVTEGKYDYNKATIVDPSKYNDDAFSDLDQIIKSKIALSEDYKAIPKFAFGVMKQCQLMLEKLSYTPNTNNYWMEKYVPLFTDIQKKGYFEPYIYYIMGSVNNDDLQKEIEKNKKKIKDFAEWAGKYIADKRNVREVTINGTKKTVHYLYYDNYLPEAFGEQDAKGKSIGDWIVYNQYTGNLQAKGSFNANGNRDGLWTYYYFDGTLKEKTNYVDGKQEGLSEMWYSNGAQKGKYNYKNDKLNGEVTEYNSSGIISTHGTYVNDKPIGHYELYYADSKLHYTANYAEGGLEGPLKEYYLNGQLSVSSNCKQGKKDGATSDYWSTGKLKDTGVYKEDNQIGAWKFYSQDGTLEKTGNFNSAGKPVDLWTSYFRNGKKSEEFNYNSNGQLNGMDILYDDDGLKYGQLEFKNDELQHITYYDKTGKVIYDNKLNNGKIDQQNFYPTGVKASEGLVKDGKRSGTWKFYSVTGALSAVEHYDGDSMQAVLNYILKDNGKKVKFKKDKEIKHEGRNGMQTDYYADGKVKDSVYYNDDLANGRYHSYFENGQLKAVGWFVMGTKEGDWYYYNAHGVLSAHTYYLFDNVSGYDDFYDVEGHISTEEYTNSLGYFDKCTLYDSTGKVTFSYVSDKGNGTYKTTYSNGQEKSEHTYISGNADGHQKTFYYNGKLKTECDFVSDNHQGKYTSYYENGNIESVFNYEIGSANGDAMRYFENGKTKTIEHYLNDNEDGNYRENYENGKPLRIGQFTNGDKQGKMNLYFEDSSLCAVTDYHNGLIIGYSYAGKDGNPVAEIPVEKGNASVTCYYANGTKSLECTYVNGMFEGKRTVYTPEGKPYEEETYKQGNEMGTQKYYYRSGKIKAEENYYWGDKDGASTYYYETGKTEHTESWVSGKRHGLFKYYDKTGKLIKTVTYYDDDEIAEK